MGDEQRQKSRKTHVMNTCEKRLVKFECIAANAQVVGHVGVSHVVSHAEFKDLGKAQAWIQTNQHHPFVSVVGYHQEITQTRASTQITLLSERIYSKDIPK